LKTAENLKPHVTAVSLSVILHVIGFINVCNILEYLRKLRTNLQLCVL
jgi:hypothetical protein